jgi:hypothetical protein
MNGCGGIVDSEPLRTLGVYIAGKIEPYCNYHGYQHGEKIDFRPQFVAFRQGLPDRPHRGTD